VIAILGVIKPCTCSYVRALRFLIPCSYAYLDSLGKFGLRASKKCRIQAGFGLGPGSGSKMRPIYNSGLAPQVIRRPGNCAFLPPSLRPWLVQSVLRDITVDCGDRFY